MYRTADFPPPAKRLALLSLCTLTLLLGACAGQKPKPPTAAEQSVAQLQYWTIKGKLGVRAPGDSGSANMTWEQRTAPSYRINLSGPLGAGATVISGTPGGVTLQRGSEPPLRASNPAALTVQALGWPLPITEMFYWVRGLTAPGSAPTSEKRDARGLLQNLQQAGWNLTFSGYQNRGPYVLPTKIKASTDQGAGPVQVTLVIKDWQI